MSLFDRSEPVQEASQESTSSLSQYSVPLTHLANTEVLNTGNPSIYNTRSQYGVVESTSYAIGAGLVNIANSFANSAKALYNIPVSQEYEKDMVDTADILRGYSPRWADFYNDHRTSIEFTSDVAALFIPGTFAVKALGMAAKSNAAIKTAKQLGKVPEFSDRMWGALDIFDTQGRRAAFAAKAMKADAQAPMFKGYNFLRAKEATLESINESMVTTAAMALSLNQSSIFDDYGINDFVRDVAFGTALTAPIKYLIQGKQVSNERVLQGIKYNQQNRVSGDFSSDPWDERISRKLNDLRNVTDPQILKRAQIEVLEDFKQMMKGTEKERASLFGALRPHLESLDPQTYDDLWLGTDNIKYFDPSQADDPKSFYVNTRNGKVNLLNEITPTAGDLRINITNNGPFTLMEQGKARIYSDKSFTEPKDGFFTNSAAAVEGYTLSVMNRVMNNPRAFSMSKDLVGEKGYALQGMNFAHLEAGYAQALKTNDMVPFIFGTQPKAMNASQIKVLLQGRKEQLVRKALDNRMPIDDINVRFGVDTEKMLATNFQEGFLVRKTPSTTDDVKRMMQPTHVMGTRRELPGEFTNRAAMLAFYDVRAQQGARSMAYKTNVGVVARTHLDFDLEQLGAIDATMATIDGADGTKLLLPGGQGAYASPLNVAETNGTITARGMETAKQKILRYFTMPTAPFGQNPALRAEFSAALATIRANPARLQLVDLGDGQGLLFDPIAKAPITAADTGQAYTVSLEVKRLLQAGLEANSKLIAVHNARVKATGRGKMLNPDVLYAPPPNIERMPHVSFVKSQNGQVRAITAASAEDLQEATNVIYRDNPGVEIITMADAKRNKQLYAEFKDSSLFDDPEFDFAMYRKGSFSPAIPRSDETVIGDFVEWHTNQTGRLVRQIVRDSLSDQLDELEFMGNQWADAQRTMGNRGDSALRKGNPYHDLIKTTLNLSKYDEYTALKSVNQTMEAIYSQSVGSMRQGIQDALERGQYEKAQAEIAKHFAKTGQNYDYSSMTNLMLANRRTRTTQLSDDVNALNGALATLSLGIDVLHPIVNALGFGIVGWPELRSLAAKFGKGADVDSALGVIVPNTDKKLPAPTKVMAGVIKDMFSAEKRAALKAKYANVQTIDSTIFEAQDSIDEMIRLMAQGPQGAVKNFVKSNVERIKKHTVVAPNAWLQIMAHEVADRMVRAAGMTDEKMIGAVRAQFSKRVNGNYTSSQRGALLQGPLGHALGLFQTWTLGVASNMMRYVANKETSNIAAFLTAQSGIFGLQSNPAFQALNSHLAARSSENEGLYQKYTDLGDLGDFLLYGAPSHTLGMSLYTRGDITPRNPTILPTGISEVPIINATIRTYGALAGLWGKTISDFDASGMSAFGNVDNNLMSAIALSGLNRPLAGLTQVYNGYSQVTAGGIGGQVIDPDIVDASAWTRVVGSRPLSEQKLLDAYYRKLDVEAADRKKAEVIGATIRARVASGNEPTSDELRDFAAQYIAVGGNPAGVKQFLTNQMLLANTGLADRMYKKMHTDGDLAEWRALLSAYEAPGE